MLTIKFDIIDIVVWISDADTYIYIPSCKRNQIDQIIVSCSWTVQDNKETLKRIILHPSSFKPCLSLRMEEVASTLVHRHWGNYIDYSDQC